MSPADLFQSANSPVGAARLWATWIGIAAFIALIFWGMVDWTRRGRLGPVSIALAIVVVVALVLVFLLPHG